MQHTIRTFKYVTLIFHTQIVMNFPVRFVIPGLGLSVGFNGKFVSSK